jgi:nitroreductase
MELETALRTRRSIRCYKSDPVPREVIRSLLDQARWSPSWANSQCWQVQVVTGEALDRLKSALRLLESNEMPPHPDFRMPDRSQWPEALREHSQALIRELDLARRLEPAAEAASRREFFDAPCLVLVGVDHTLVPDYACFDAGAFVQSFCLAAHAQGLGTCILAMAVRHPELLRQELPGTGHLAFVVGVALGYPDLEAPINTFERPRARLDDFVHWAG